MRRPNHASRFEGIAKTNLQASSASDTETLQSQVDKAGKKRLSLSGLEILHGRLTNRPRPRPRPILLRFTLHGWCICVFHFEPIGRAAGTVGRTLALRDDAFEAKLAGVGKDGRAVALDMLIEPDAGAGLGYDRCECGLANLKRIAPQVVAVQLDQVEGVEKYALIS